MKVIPRLEQLRKEVAEIDRDLAELGGRQTSLAEGLRKVETARDASLIARYRAGEPVRVTDIDTKTKKLEDELRVVEVTLEALQKHKDVLMPELSELSIAQKEAEGWHEVGVNFVAAKVLNTKLRARGEKALATAVVKKCKTSMGDERVEKSIPNFARSLPFYILRLEFLTLEAAHRIDPSHFPKPETVDLTTVDRGFGGFDTRATRNQDRRLLLTIWQRYLAIEQQLLQENGLDIAPSAEEIAEKIKEVIPPPSRPDWAR